MVTNQFDRDELVRQLAWQHAEGIDEALLDDPASDSPLTLRDILPRKARPQQAEQTGAAATTAGKNPAVPMAPAASPGPSTAPSSGSGQPVDQPVGQPVDQVVDQVAGHAAPAPPSAELAALTTLEALRDALGRLDQCPLKHTASNMIFADGNPGARLMVIGEVPGREEDRVGLPLVGGAGQLFDRMLASIGLTRADIYITSLLPWRPPGNRTPTPEEMDMLLPWLHRHVQLAAPQQVLLLGGGPAKAILPDGGGILKLRGRWKDIDFGDGVVRPTMATLHPSYLLRSPAQKRLAFADLVALANKLG